MYNYNYNCYLYMVNDFVTNEQYVSAMYLYTKLGLHGIVQFHVEVTQLQGNFDNQHYIKIVVADYSTHSGHSIRFKILPNGMIQNTTLLENKVLEYVDKVKNN